MDVINNYDLLKDACDRLASVGTRASLFIAPDIKQIEKAIMMNVPVIEIHTGHYANLLIGTKYKQTDGYAVDFANIEWSEATGTAQVEKCTRNSTIKDIKELNIGHSIVAEALFVGWEKAIKDMKRIITRPTLI